MQLGLGLAKGGDVVEKSVDCGSSERKVRFLLLTGVYLLGPRAPPRVPFRPRCSLSLESSAGRKWWILASRFFPADRSSRCHQKIFQPLLRDACSCQREDYQDWLCAIEKGAISVPSPATLSRARLKLDVLLMKTRRLALTKR